MYASENVSFLWRKVDPQVDTREIRDFSVTASVFLDGLVESNLTQNQYDALVSLTIDVVCHGLHSVAQLREEILSPLNNGYMYVVSQSFETFCLRGGVIDKMMLHRRRLESNLFKGRQIPFDNRRN